MATLHKHPIRFDSNCFRDYLYQFIDGVKMESLLFLSFPCLQMQMFCFKMSPVGRLQHKQAKILIKVLVVRKSHKYLICNGHGRHTQNNIGYEIYKPFEDHFIFFHFNYFWACAKGVSKPLQLVHVVQPGRSSIVNQIEYFMLIAKCRPLYHSSQDNSKNIKNYKLYCFFNKANIFLFKKKKKRTQWL